MEMSNLIFVLKNNIVTGGHVMHVGRGTLNHGLPFIYPMNSDKNVQVPCVLSVKASTKLHPRIEVRLVF